MSASLFLSSVITIILTWTWCVLLLFLIWIKNQQRSCGMRFSSSVFWNKNCTGLDVRFSASFFCNYNDTYLVVVCASLLLSFVIINKTLVTVCASFFCYKINTYLVLVCVSLFLNSGKKKKKTGLCGVRFTSSVFWITKKALVLMYASLLLSSKLKKKHWSWCRLLCFFLL
jgi:hypothetical protein